MADKAQAENADEGGIGRDPRWVVACVDGSPDGDRAVRYAVAEAWRRDLGLRVVHVQPEATVFDSLLAGLSSEMLHEVAAWIVKRAEQLAHDCGWAGTGDDVALAEGPRSDGILAAHAGDAGCLVVGRRSSTVDHLLSGSTTASLAAHAEVPLISVPEEYDPATEAGVVVVWVDACDCQESDDVIRAGFDQARRRGASVELVHAWRPASCYDVAIGLRVLEGERAGSIQRALTRRIRRMPRIEGVNRIIKPRFDRPELALHEASGRADLLVVGRHGHHSRVHRAIGATARTALRTSRCPVLVVPTTTHAQARQVAS